MGHISGFGDVPERWRAYVALLITLLWVVSYAVSAATQNYAGLGTVTPVMLIAAAYLLHSDIVKRNGGKDG